MKLTGFSAAACKNGPRYFVGKKDQFVNEEEFLIAISDAYKLDQNYQKPTIDMLSIDYVCPTEDDSFSFCAEHEPGAFEVYVLAEEDLIEGDERI